MRYRSPARLSFREASTTPSKQPPPQQPSSPDDTLSSQRPLVTTIPTTPCIARSQEEDRAVINVINRSTESPIVADNVLQRKGQDDVTHASPATMRSGGRDQGYESLDSRRLLLGNQQLEVNTSTVV